MYYRLNGKKSRLKIVLYIANLFPDRQYIKEKIINWKIKSSTKFFSLFILLFLQHINFVLFIITAHSNKVFVLHRVCPPMPADHALKL